MKKKLLSILMMCTLLVSVGCAKKFNSANLNKPVVGKPVVEEVQEVAEEEQKENAVSVIAEEEDAPTMGGPKNVGPDGKPILDKDGIPIDNYFRMADQMYMDIQPILADGIQYSNTEVVYYKEDVLYLDVYVAHNSQTDNDLNFLTQFPVVFAEIMEAVDYHVEADFHIVDSSVYFNTVEIDELGYTVYPERPAVLDNIEVKSTHSFSTEE